METKFTVQQLSSFVQRLLDEKPTAFTLDGEQISSVDLASPTGLLPLVVVTANENIKHLMDAHQDDENYIAVSPHDTHMLGCEVQDLPNIPHGQLLLHVNTALNVLARAPVSSLHLPRDISDQDLPATSELRAHIQRHAIFSRTAERTSENSASLGM